MPHTREEALPGPRAATSAPAGGADFRRLWIGETVSLLGGQVTALALPLTAVLALGATPAEMGLLGAVETLPWMLIGLPAGAWVDRMARRRVLIATDLGRALLIGCIPAAAALGLLAMPVLYGVAFLSGILAVFFEVAYNAYLPSLVPRAALLAGNSRLQASASAAEIGGPGLAGALVQAIGAPAALLVDALSYLVSVAYLARIRAREPARPRLPGRRLTAEMREGLAALWGNPLLRLLVTASGGANLFFAIQGALRVLYAERDLGLSPALLGAVLAAGSAGGLLGALPAASTARRFGTGPTIIGAVGVMGAGALLVPLAAGPALVAGAVLAGGLALTGLGATTYIVTVGSLRQAITPDRLQGRIAATARFISRSALPVGFLLGGLLGGTLGLRATLLIPAAGPLLLAAWLLFTPLRRLHDRTSACRGEMKARPALRPGAHPCPNSTELVVAHGHDKGEPGLLDVGTVRGLYVGHIGARHRQAGDLDPDFDDDGAECRDDDLRLLDGRRPPAAAGHRQGHAQRLVAKVMQLDGTLKHRARDHHIGRGLRRHGEAADRARNAGVQGRGLRDAGRQQQGCQQDQSTKNV